MRSRVPTNWNLPPGVTMDEVDPPDYWIEDNKVEALIPEPEDEDMSLPYPWCARPETCRGRGSCPRDPSCGD